MKRCVSISGSMLAAATISAAAFLALPALADSGSGGLRYTVLVSKFENKTRADNDTDLGDSWRTTMTAALDATGRFMVISEADMRQGAVLEEQAFGASGATKVGNSTPQRGQLSPAQLLVKGEITHYSTETSGQNGGLQYKGIKLGGGRTTTEIRATIYMVDSSTGLVVGSKNVKGVAQGRSSLIGFEKNGISGGMGQSAKASPVEALNAAVDEAVQFMIGKLPSVIWRGEVLAVKQDGSIVVNRGTREGVQSGWSFAVGDYEILRDPDTGEVLDVNMNERAQLQVVQAKEKISVCKVVGGEGTVLVKGMGITRQ